MAYWLTLGAKHRECWTCQPGQPTRCFPSQGVLHGGQPCHPARPEGPRPEHPHSPREGGAAVTAAAAARGLRSLTRRVRVGLGPRVSSCKAVGDQPGAGVGGGTYRFTQH